MINRQVSLHYALLIAEEEKIHFNSESTFTGYIYSLYSSGLQRDDPCICL
jgi:hypothetical protein